MTQSVQLEGPAGRSPADIDQRNKAVVVQDEIHSNIHRGVFFSVGHINMAVADDAVLEILIVTGADDSVHARMTTQVGGDSEAALFEDATYSAAGTALTPRNRNRFASDTVAAAFTHTPTLTADGTALAAGFIPGGTKNQSFGGEGSTFEEWILKNATTYLIRITNRGGSAQPVALGIDFYEAT